MSVSVVIDMSLSPEWESFLNAEGIPAVHWSSVGPPNAPDTLIMEWAAKHQHVVFTNDLDFGTMLALTGSAAPSVIQIRHPKVLPEFIGQTVAGAI